MKCASNEISTADKRCIWSESPGRRQALRKALLRQSFARSGVDTRAAHWDTARRARYWICPGARRFQVVYRLRGPGVNRVSQGRRNDRPGPQMLRSSCLQFCLRQPRARHFRAASRRGLGVSSLSGGNCQRSRAGLQKLRNSLCPLHLAYLGP